MALFLTKEDMMRLAEKLYAEHIAGKDRQDKTRRAKKDAHLNAEEYLSAAKTAVEEVEKQRGKDRVRAAASGGVVGVTLAWLFKDCARILTGIAAGSGQAPEEVDLNPKGYWESLRAWVDHAWNKNSGVIEMRRIGDGSFKAAGGNGDSLLSKFKRLFTGFGELKETKPVERMMVILLGVATAIGVAQAVHVYKNIRRARDFETGALFKNAYKAAQDEGRTLVVADDPEQNAGTTEKSRSASYKRQKDYRASATEQKQNASANAVS